MTENERRDGYQRLADVAQIVGADAGTDTGQHYWAGVEDALRWAAGSATTNGIKRVLTVRNGAVAALAGNYGSDEAFRAAARRFNADLREQETRKRRAARGGTR